MQLHKVKYCQHESNERHWTLDELELGTINLLVGKNSAGKSKSIAIIRSLAQLLSENNKLSFLSGHFNTCFNSDNGSVYRYELKYDNTIVVREKLHIDETEYLVRDSDGEGTILAIKNNDLISHEFKIPSDELKAVRRDEKQYPYLEELNFWARHVRLFVFGDNTQKSSYAVLDSEQSTETQYNLKTPMALDTFQRGFKKYKKKFTDKIIEDFNSIGYDITKIDAGSLSDVSFKMVGRPNNVELVGIRVKENGLQCMTDQSNMSSGMFRALSVIIHFNYYELEKIPGCVMIDDIGEGLDFERSVNLIQLLVSKVESGANKVQLIMSTNDRYVMNGVDIKYWQIIDREGCNVKYYNQNNSSKIFSDFKFTGLNNFDFYATDFFKKGFQDETGAK